MCDSCSYEDAVQEIDEALLDQNSKLGLDVITRIREGITDHDHVTDRQLTAMTIRLEAQRRRK